MTTRQEIAAYDQPDEVPAPQDWSAWPETDARTEKLAATLYCIAYDIPLDLADQWGGLDDEGETRTNYRLDAEEIMLAYPNLQPINEQEEFQNANRI